MTDTLPDHKLETNARLPSGLKATAVGLKPTPIVATTDLDDVSITETVFAP